MPQSNAESILIGEPIIKELDVGRAIYDGRLVEAKVFTGSSVLEPRTPTVRLEVVTKLLSPLSSGEVGTIRCTGLNIHVIPRCMAKANI